MIAFHTWLAQIVGYGSLIANRLDLRKAWVDRDLSITSVTDFDELYEQVFDDLDSDTFEAELESHLSTDVAARTALLNFLDALRRVDRLREQRVKLRDAAALLDSAEWHDFEDAALQVVSICGPAVRTGA